MAIDILKHAGLNPETDEQARAAVREFRKLQPTLSAYARMITGRKDVRVLPATRDNGATDGQNIYFRPPMELGDRTPHNRSQCDKRGSDGHMLCPACKIRESIMVTIFHEISHIAYDSFAPTTDNDRRLAVEFAVKETRGRWASEVADRIKNAPKWKLADYINLSSLINEFLPTLVNCLEDARINNELFKARPGMRKMFLADTVEIFTKGFEVNDGFEVRMQKWSEAPLNHQAMLGCFVKASGYDYTGWFHPDVEAALNDDELTRLTDQIVNMKSASGVYNLSFKVLARLRDLGFCGTPQDPDPEPEPEEEPHEEDSPKDDSDDSDSESGGQPSSEEGEHSEAPTSDEPGSDGDSGKSDSDPVPDEDASDPEGGTGDGTSPEGSGGEQADSPEEGAPDATGSEQVDEESDTPTEGDSDGMASDDVPQDHDSSESEAGSSDDDPEGTGSGDSPSDDSAEAEYDSQGDDSGDAAGDDSVRGEDSDVSGEQSGHGDSSGTVPPMGGEHGEVSEADDESVRDSEHDEGESGEVDAEASDGSSDGGESGERSDDGGTSGSDEGSSTPPVEGEAGTGEVENVGTEAESSDGDSPADAERDDGSPDGPTEPDSREGDAPPEVDEPDDEDGDPIDTGADDGYGGTKALGEEKQPPRPEMGDPWDVKLHVQEWTGHKEKPKSLEVSESTEDAIDRAIIQGLYFTKPSSNIWGVKEHYWNQPIYNRHENVSNGWSQKKRKWTGAAADIIVPDTLLQGVLMRARRVFSDNQRGGNTPNQKSGRINARVLGKRAWSGDERLFYKRTRPGKRSYFVVIGMDISGSTVGVNLALEKRAVYAKAELLERVGIPFAIYAHTGNYHDGFEPGLGLDLEVYMVKEPHEPWNDKTIERLDAIGPVAANLDGHALEYLRKKADQAAARGVTDVIVVYYSDGKMPLENYEEEAEILRDEIATCRRKGYTLLGVGIRTDSPAQHGLDTVQVDTDEDISKVIDQLGRRLTENA